MMNRESERIWKKGKLILPVYFMMNNYGMLNYCHIDALDYFHASMMTNFVTVNLPSEQTILGELSFHAMNPR